MDAMRQKHELRTRQAQSGLKQHVVPHKFGCQGKHLYEKANRPMSERSMRTPVQTFAPKDTAIVKQSGPMVLIPICERKAAEGSFTIIKKSKDTQKRRFSPDSASPAEKRHKANHLTSPSSPRTQKQRTNSSAPGANKHLAVSSMPGDSLPKRRGRPPKNSAHNAIALAKRRNTVPSFVENRQTVGSVKKKQRATTAGAGGSVNSLEGTICRRHPPNNSIDTSSPLLKSQRNGGGSVVKRRHADGSLVGQSGGHVRIQRASGPVENQHLSPVKTRQAASSLETRHAGSSVNSRNPTATAKKSHHATSSTKSRKATSSQKSRHTASAVVWNPLSISAPRRSCDTISPCVRMRPATTQTDEVPTPILWDNSTQTDPRDWSLPPQTQPRWLRPTAVPDLNQNPFIKSETFDIGENSEPTSQHHAVRSDPGMETWSRTDRCNSAERTDLVQFRRAVTADPDTPDTDAPDPVTDAWGEVDPVTDAWDEVDRCSESDEADAPEHPLTGTAEFGGMSTGTSAVPSPPVEAAANTPSASFVISEVSGTCRCAQTRKQKRHPFTGNSGPPRVATTSNSVTRVWDRRNVCCYCERFVLKLFRHLKRRHKNEDAVKEVVVMPKGSKEQLEALYLLRNKGNYIHNMKVKSGVKEGYFIPARRLSARNGGTVKLIEDFAPCDGCQGFFLKIQLNRHRESCKFVPKPGEPEKSQAYSSACFKLQNILDGMPQDELAEICKTDPDIVQYGEKLLRSLEHKPRARYRISTSMRSVARLLQAFRKHSPGACVLDLLSPDKFSEVTECVKSIACERGVASRCGVPPMAVTLGHCLRKCAIFVEEDLVQKGQDAMRVRRFLDMYGSQWAHQIGRCALTSPKKRRWIEPQGNPSTEYLERLVAEGDIIMELSEETLEELIGHVDFDHIEEVDEAELPAEPREEMQVRDDREVCLEPIQNIETNLMTGAQDQHAAECTERVCLEGSEEASSGSNEAVEKSRKEEEDRSEKACSKDEDQAAHSANVQMECSDTDHEEHVETVSENCSAKVQEDRSLNVQDKQITKVPEKLGEKVQQELNEEAQDDDCVNVQDEQRKETQESPSENEGVKVQQDLNEKAQDKDCANVLDEQRKEIQGNPMEKREEECIEKLERDPGENLQDDGSKKALEKPRETLLDERGGKGREEQLEKGQEFTKTLQDQDSEEIQGDRNGEEGGCEDGQQNPDDEDSWKVQERGDNVQQEHNSEKVQGAFSGQVQNEPGILVQRENCVNVQDESGVKTHAPGKEAQDELNGKVQGEDSEAVGESYRKTALGEWNQTVKDERSRKMQDNGSDKAYSAPLEEQKQPNETILGAQNGSVPGESGREVRLRSSEAGQEERSDQDQEGSSQGVEESNEGVCSRRSETGQEERNEELLLVQGILVEEDQDQQGQMCDAGDGNTVGSPGEELPMEEVSADETSKRSSKTDAEVPQHEDSGTRKLNSNSPVEEAAACEKSEDSRVTQTPENSPKRPKSRKSTVKKRMWTATERMAIMRHLSRYIENREVPGKVACEKAIEAGPELASRPWREVKYFVYNRIAAAKR